MRYKILLTLILTVALLVRLYKIDNPVADWHSWRQADTASVTRMFVLTGVDLLHPKYHDLSNIPSGKDNPQGYRMVEFPIYNLIHYSVYRLLPFWGLDVAGRLTSVLISLISIYFIYLSVCFISSPVVGLTTAFILAVLPFNIYYSRVILPEPLMICSFFISFFLFTRYLLSKTSQRLFYLFASAFFFSVALLVKPYAIFFTLPYLYLLWQNKHQTKSNSVWLFLGLIVAIAPLLLWRQWISQFPEGIPASNWLYNLNGIRFRPAWFRWLFGERLGKLVLGYWGIGPFILGVTSKLKHKTEFLYLLWALGIIAYFAVFAGGNVTHDYYQAIIIPFVAMILAKGLTSAPPKAAITMLFCFVLMLSLSWYEIRGYYQINNPNIITAGKVADSLLPQTAKVIASYNGDTAFLYQTHRQGWPAISDNIQNMVNKGAEYYISTNYDQEANTVLSLYPHNIVSQTKDYLIVKLK